MTYETGRYYRRRFERRIMITIEKAKDGYVAHVTAPHVQEEWRNPMPLGRSELIEELRRRGVHTTDIADAFHEADRRT